MGLDIYVREFVEIPDDVKTEAQLKAFCESGPVDLYWIILDEEGFKYTPKKYIKTIPVEVIDWVATFKKFNRNPDDYSLGMQGGGQYGFVLKNSEQAGEDRMFYINYDEVVTVVKPCPIFIRGRELGYQRKGANGQFYDDGMWDPNKIVTTKKVLLEHWRKYFSDNTNEYYGKETKAHFKEHIIDKFVPGKSYVIYC